MLGTCYDNHIYTTTYKYDTLTDTYTQLTNIPYFFFDGSAVAIGTDIYLFGGENTSNYTNRYNAYKYDTAETFEEISKYEYSDIEILIS
ncbi:MAG: hypothetical protein K2H53_02140, partial [Clostridia bacterium]|nr:hypothetical protein [Clostridia bacterium]